MNNILIKNNNISIIFSLLILILLIVILFIDNINAIKLITFVIFCITSFNYYILYINHKELEKPIENTNLLNENKQLKDDIKIKNIEIKNIESEKFEQYVVNTMTRYNTFITTKIKEKLNIDNLPNFNIKIFKQDYLYPYFDLFDYSKKNINEFVNDLNTEKDLQVVKNKLSNILLLLIFESFKIYEYDSNNIFNIDNIEFLNDLNKRLNDFMIKLLK